MNKKILLLVFGMVFLIGFLVSVSALSQTSYFPLNETVGNVIDQAGNFTATNYSATRGVTGVLNTAYQFDGANNYVVLNKSMFPYTTYGSWTANFYVKTTNTSTTPLLLASGSTVSNYYDNLQIQTNGTVSARIRRNTDDLTIQSNGSAITDGNWHMLTWVRDTSSSKMYLYQDGVLVAEGSETNVLTNDMKVDTEWGFGASTFTGAAHTISNPFNGTLDELHVYSQALTQSEINSLVLVPQIALNYPSNSLITSNSSINFNSSYSGTSFTFNNATYYVWYSNGTLFNSTTVSVPASNLTSLTISGFSIGSYKWNVLLNYDNSTGTSTVWGGTNYTFTTQSIAGTPTYNSTTYETATETYSETITPFGGTAPTFPQINWNGTNYTATSTSLGNGNYTLSYSKDIPTVDSASNITFSFNWFVGSTYATTSTYNQTINITTFTLCNATYTTKFLNLTFEDEGNFSVINGTIPTSTFTYYLGSGSVNKTYTYINTTESTQEYFCASPTTRTFYVTPYVQYKNGVSYPQRIWNPAVQTYNSTITNQILYLLSSTDGIYVTFQVINPAEQGIEGVDVTGTRSINGVDVQIASGTTGAGGGVTFWLNPDFPHTFVFTKSGYDTYTTTLTPTQSGYTITLGSTASSQPEYTQGVTYSINPNSDFLLYNTSYNFNFTISSTYYTLDSFGFNLLYENGTIITTQTSTANTGGTVSYTFNTTNSSRIIMDYYYTINGTTTNGTRYWIMYEESGFSVWHLFTDVTTYIGANIFGINGDDGGIFARALISVLILIFGAGILSSRYGLASEPAIMGILFGLVLLLNTLGFLPTLTGFPTSSSSVSIGVLLEIVFGVMTFAFILKEESY